MRFQAILRQRAWQPTSNYPEHVFRIETLLPFHTSGPSSCAWQRWILFNGDITRVQPPGRKRTVFATVLATVLPVRFCQR